MENTEILNEHEIVATPGSYISDEEAQAVATEMFQIQKTKPLVAEAVVEAAKDPNSALHSNFEWDDSVAAQKHRLQQARVLINAVSYRVAMLDKDDPERVRTVPVFVNVYKHGNDAKPAVKQYVQLAEALVKADLKAQVLEKAKAEMISWKNRYKQYQVLADAMPIVDMMVEKIEEIKEKLSV